ncbi:cell division protein ZipA C-terminal FtsZ-binding domain-containing protein [Ostreibacterium oceani]|uniref:Cell division protein ZipA n=1 Tax=Ostreibacterium oceani TaxID=2654998 RepID=A0A6N7EYJ3_9GAMM|nr:cell division protein ZipA C-terminal FtsZ-binding domain-containing protein [Ostreibacterium oceani]MPV86449.1 hypothetical protein [Ostreibacterium oceani]
MDVEQATLIWITRLVFILLSGVIAYVVWAFMRRERVVNVPPTPAYEPPKDVKLPEKHVVITVMAKPGRFFDNHQLINLLDELGFVYSEHGVFEYFLADGKHIAFTIINTKPPYTFDENPAAMRPTDGVKAVMQLPILDGYRQSEYFYLMLSVLDELRENLGAQLCDENRNLLKNQKLHEIQQAIESFEMSCAAMLQNDYQQRHNH